MCLSAHEWAKTASMWLQAFPLPSLFGQRIIYSLPGTKLGAEHTAEKEALRPLASWSSWPSGETRDNCSAGLSAQGSGEHRGRHLTRGRGLPGVSDF